MKNFLILSSIGKLTLINIIICIMLLFFFFSLYFTIISPSLFDFGLSESNNKLDRLIYKSMKNRVFNYRI